MEEIKAKIIIESEWFKDRKKKAEYNKARRERYKNDLEYKAKQQARCRKYNSTHKDTRTTEDRRQYRRNYYMANRDKLLLQADEYRLKPGYKEKHSEYMKQYHKKYGW